MGRMPRAAGRPARATRLVGPRPQDAARRYAGVPPRVSTPPPERNPRAGPVGGDDPQPLPGAGAVPGLGGPPAPAYPVRGAGGSQRTYRSRNGPGLCDAAGCGTARVWGAERARTEASRGPQTSGRREGSPAAGDSGGTGKREDHAVGEFLPGACPRPRRPLSLGAGSSTTAPHLLPHTGPGPRSRKPRHNLGLHPASMLAADGPEPASGLLSTPDGARRPDAVVRRARRSRIAREPGPDRGSD